MHESGLERAGRYGSFAGVDCGRDGSQTARPFRVVLLAGAGLGDQKECSREQIAAIVGRAHHSWGRSPSENLWHYLRSPFWSNPLYKTWDDLKQAAIDG